MTAETNKVCALKKDGEVAMVNPTSVTSDKYRRTYQHIKEQVELTGHPVASYLSYIDSPAFFARAFNEAIASDAKALLPIAGNQFGEKVWNRIDSKKLREKGQAFVAFSGASALGLQWYIENGYTSFYGPHLPFIYNQDPTMAGNDYTINNYWSALKGSMNEIKNVYHSSVSQSLGSLDIKHHGETIMQATSEIQGTIVPAFLDSLLVLAQNDIPLDCNGKILIIDANDDFDTAIKKFDALGRIINIQHAQAILVASIVNHKAKTDLAEQSMRITHTITTLRKATNNNVPVTYGFPMGHCDWKSTVPLGVRGKLNLETNDLSIIESPYRQTS